MKSSVNNLVLERGILSSVYKQEIKRNIRSMKSESLSRIKNKLKNDSAKFYSETAIALKVSMFAIILVLLVV
ncbi:hypothetical protein WH52_03710 [Tenacibaculum holothuriorum]|uniref:Uncharacterized protein n=1 Tax=Tenacibaculum holothuriorum TaxID=1635173 RepID=A0A1Y2PE58_9FLAO|nr:hypothetical protein [Tenacibaculum holothuriorum]OSY88786.1 hypothetical protein WH52_03710 [Tenacibaculum holothuriorum]